MHGMEALLPPPLEWAMIKFVLYSLALTSVYYLFLSGSNEITHYRRAESPGSGVSSALTEPNTV